MITRFKDGYYFLSNYFPSEIWLGGRRYPTVEHFYQANKADSFQAHKYISDAKTPGGARDNANEITIRHDWDAVRIPIMRLGLILKFDIEELGDMLLNTGIQEIVSDSGTFWGLQNGIGENHLGKLLMEVRDQVIERRILQTTYIGIHNVN